MLCPVCNRTIASGDFCDDLQCPNPTDLRPRCAVCNLEDGACICAHIRPAQMPKYEYQETDNRCYGVSYQEPKSAPPKPAPDAMQKLADKIRYLHKRGLLGYNGEYSVTDADYEQLISALLSAPVPPADGAMAAMNEVLARQYGIPDELWKDATKDNPKVPSGTGAAEPVAWRWRNTAAISKKWSYIEKEMREHPSLTLEVQPLYAAPPVRGDREAIARAIYESDHAFQHEDGGEQVDGFQVTPSGYVTWNQLREMSVAACIPYLKAADAILSLHVQPGAGERESAT